MSRRSPAALLQDIVEAIRRIKIYTKGMDYDGFVQDTKTQDAVIRNIEIIGEAARNIPEPVKEDSPPYPGNRLQAPAIGSSTTTSAPTWTSSGR